MAAPESAVEPTPERAKLRVDKWLWRARFFKTRGLAAELAGSGRLRINSEHVSKPAQPVRLGDVLTFPQGNRIRVIRIVALGHRRGPAREALALYADLDEGAPAAQPHPAQASAGKRDAGTGRPTKKQRREIDFVRRNDP